jgi:transposase
VNQGTRIGSITESLAKGAGTGREFRDVEVSSVSQRRRFTAAYKCRVLAEADACTEPGQVGALLRREGLYSSHLTTWRRQREQGMLEALTPKKRGRKARGLDPVAQRVAQLERANARLSQQLKQAETIIEVQKKVSELLGM